MERTNLFDKILKHLYENKEDYWNLIPTSEQYFGITDEDLIESIVDEMIEREWVDQKNYDKFSVIIKYNGKQTFEKYKSYSSFLRDLKKSESKEKVQKNTDRILNNISRISAIFLGVSSFILSYNKFFIDDVKIDKQKTEIENLNKKIDSILIKKHNRKIKTKA
ncbi:hypothetical protein KBJ98_04410 [Flavobacterium sp. F-328]|uniref:Uncharacterized protein n=1 Tax=Flavobacterium erciyesense TaxID=2825842 RepID=A0ABS5D1Q0_9FLAO|nr:hypothetical protein [Flavobacterium erciyesense]MBQ0907939.1 hypothetical protein [Flavobacterium erciyesense]